MTALPTNVVALLNLLVSATVVTPLTSLNPGACCFENNTCFENTLRDPCESVGGWFLGVGLTCDSNPDGDGVVGCADRCPFDPDKIEPGICGCGVPDTDSDGDSIPDCFDQCPDTPPGTPVNESGCPEIGACCFPSGVCFDSIERSACKSVGAIYQGFDSQCAWGCTTGTGDVNGDDRIDLADFELWSSCATGPGVPITNEACRELDIVPPPSIDLRDFTAYSNFMGTCVSGLDTDGDGVPDCNDNCVGQSNPLVPYQPGDSDDDCALKQGLVNSDGLWQPDSNCNGVGDVCSPDPVIVMIVNPSRQAFPCEVVEFTATTDPTDAAVTWTQISGPAVSLTANDGTVVVDLPPSLTAGQAIQLRATATFPGRPNGTTNATITVLAYNNLQQVETKSRGAVQPGEQIEIRLADGEDSDWRVHWTQNPNDPPDARNGVPNPITTLGNNQTARFNAPNVVRTRKLRFNATGCMANNIGVGLMGNIVVPVQRAQIDDFALPVQINVGQQIDIPDLLMVSLIRTAQDVVEPHVFDPEVDGGDPNDPDAGGFQLLFFVLDKQGNPLPSDNKVDVDLENATFTVTAAQNNTTIQVRVMLIGIAGGPANPLAQVAKTTVVVGGS
jgi:hypothetical protein